MQDPKAFLGKGWSYPVQLDPANGQLRMSLYEQDIKEAIRIILSTAKGERIMHPNYGCGIHDIPFESINRLTTKGLVEEGIRDALIQHEPRIELLRIEANDDQAVNGRLLVSIDYRVRDTNRDDNLVYPFYTRRAK